MHGDRDVTGSAAVFGATASAMGSDRRPIAIFWLRASALVLAVLLGSADLAPPWRYFATLSKTEAVRWSG